MYEAFFEMKQTAFINSIAVDGLYLSPMLDETFSRLEFAAQKRLFTLVTAYIGYGKSTAIRKCASMLPSDRYQVLYLSDSKLTPRRFYKGLLD